VTKDFRTLLRIETYKSLSRLYISIYKVDWKFFYNHFNQSKTKNRCSQIASSFNRNPLPTSFQKGPILMKACLRKLNSNISNSFCNKRCFKHNMQIQQSQIKTKSVLKFYHNKPLQHLIRVSPGTNQSSITIKNI
jgi:hypothetical protein